MLLGKASDKGLSLKAFLEWLEYEPEVLTYYEQPEEIPSHMVNVILRRLDKR